MFHRAHRPNHWHEWENEILRELYPAGGAMACLKELPHRTYNAIGGHANTLGLSAKRTYLSDDKLAAADHRALNAALNHWTATPEKLRL